MQEDLLRIKINKSLVFKSSLFLREFPKLLTLHDLSNKEEFHKLTDTLFISL